MSAASNANNQVLAENVRELAVGIDRIETGMAQLETGVHQLDSGMSQLQSGLGDLASNLRVTTLDEDFSIGIFGALVGEAIFAEQRPIIPSGIVLISPDFGQQTPTVDVHGKQSFLGVGVEGPEICGLQAGGLVLTYFYGENYIADLNGLFIVRAYGDLKNDQFRFAIGLEGDVINPLNPGMLDFNMGLAAGNIGFFRGQFRFESYLHFSDTAQLTTQLALGNPIQTSFDGELRNLLEDDGWPNVEAHRDRAWLSYRKGGRGDPAN